MRPVRGPDGLEASREVVGSHLRDDGSVASGLVPDRLRDALRSAAVDQPRRVHDVAGPCVRGTVFGFWRRRMQHVNPCAANAPQKGLAATPGLRFRIARLCLRQVVPQIGVIQDRLPCTFTFRVLAGRVDVRDVRSDDHQGVSVSSLSTAPAFERLAGCGDCRRLGGDARVVGCRGRENDQRRGAAIPWSIALVIGLCLLALEAESRSRPVREEPRSPLGAWS